MCDKKCTRFPFKHSKLCKNLPQEPGIYAFWFGRTCVYVGKTERQTLRDRLIKHWESTHNDILELWIKAKNDKLDISYKIIDKRSEIHRYERYYIKILNPLANKTR